MRIAAACVAASDMRGEIGERPTFVNDRDCRHPTIPLPRSDKLRDLWHGGRAHRARPTGRSINLMSRLRRSAISIVSGIGEGEGRRRWPIVRRRRQKTLCEGTATIHSSMSVLTSVCFQYMWTLSSTVIFAPTFHFAAAATRPGAIRQSVLSPSIITPLLFNATNNFLCRGIRGFLSSSSA